MKMNLAILDKDTLYSQRLANCFNNTYFDKFTIFTFDTIEALNEVVKTNKIDLVLLSLDYDFNELEGVSVIYMVNDKDIDSYKEQKALCKFQKVELIYKSILDIYS